MTAIKFPRSLGPMMGLYNVSGLTEVELDLLREDIMGVADELDCGPTEAATVHYNRVGGQAALRGYVDSLLAGEAHREAEKAKAEPSAKPSAGDLKFYSSDLGREITIAHWLLEILETLIIEEEGFSGKRPLGNSDWKGDAEAALVKAGLLDVVDSTQVFLDIIKTMKVGRS